MNTLPEIFGWAQIRVFLAVADEGSLSGAATALGLSQPTIGRHIHAMEAACGVTLFTRQPKGMVLTDAGAALLGPAQAMRDAAREVNLAAAGADPGVSGTVRITASVFASHHILPPILARARREMPDVEIDLVPSDSSQNLLFREADIAVRMYRPRQLEIVTRHIGDLRLGLFGAKSYIAERGCPGTRDDLMAHDFVGYDRNEDILQGFADLGFPVRRDFFGVRCDLQSVYWELVRAGCGLGFAQVSSGRADPTVDEIPVDLGLPPLEVWLAAHSGIRHVPRVARTWDILADGLTDACRVPA